MTIVPAQDHAGRAAFRKQPRPNARIRLLGGEMDLVRPAEVMRFIAERVAAGTKTVVANHNLHSLHLLRRCPQMRELYARAALIEVDSAPLLAWARLVHGHARGFHRCTYLDWREAFWSLAEAQGWRVYVLAGAPGVVVEARAALTARWPSLTLQGRHGYLQPGEDEAVVQTIAAARPDVLMVGMGMPRQEAFIARNYDALPSCVILPVGAAFDYEAGVQIAAPRWLGRLGLEWLFRLALNPRRLFRRYCLEPWTLLSGAAGDLRQLCATSRSRVPSGASELAAEAGDDLDHFPLRPVGTSQRKPKPQMR